MLNWAARYYPILRVLKQQLGEVESLLEVGSGSIGIGKFRSSPFVGSDVSFPIRPVSPMLPVIADGTKLPFGDRRFDAVVVSDVLEHVPPAKRMAVIQESLRVARRIAVFGFPSGVQAFEYDQKLAGIYDRRRQARPAWLQEHMRYPFPAEELFCDVRDEWAISSFGNEWTVFHHWVMVREMRRLWAYLFQIPLAAAPRTVEYLLRRIDREPFYRKIVVARRLCTAPR
jgi:hypothetical protein